MKALFMVAVFFLLYTASTAQAVEEWVVHFNGISNTTDELIAMVIDNSGNTYITGRSIGDGSTVNPWDIVTIKYNADGEAVWIKTFGEDNKPEEPSDIKVDSEGNVYITGYVTGNQLNADFITIKYNAGGDTVWTRRYNGPANGDDIGIGVVVDDISGWVFVTGSSRGILSTTDFNYLTIAYDAAGVQQWVSSYDGPGNSTDIPTSIAYKTGEVIVSGSSRATTSSLSADFFTIKYTAQSGDTLWTKRYNGSGNSFDEAKSIAIDQSGNIYVTGISSTGSQPTDRDFATIKYSSSGDEEWVKIYNNVTTDEAYSLAVDSDANVYTTGHSTGFGTMNDYATIKYNSSGQELWVSRYHGPLNSSDDAASALAIDESGNIYVTGFSIGLNNNSDFFTIKYNDTGDTVWTARYNGPGNGNDRASSVALDGSANVYVSGTSTGSGTASDFTLIKYSQSATDVVDNTKFSPHEFSLLANYPNPFNPATTIQYRLPAEGIVILKIFDILGREIETLVEESKFKGKHQAVFETSKLSSGIYIYTLDFTGIDGRNFRESKKMMLVK